MSNGHKPWSSFVIGQFGVLIGLMLTVGGALLSAAFVVWAWRVLTGQIQ